MSKRFNVLKGVIALAVEVTPRRGDAAGKFELPEPVGSDVKEVCDCSDAHIGFPLRDKETQEKRSF